MYIKKGDIVTIIAGSHKGKTSEVESCNPQEDRAVVQGINIRTHHKKSRVRGQKGKIVKKEHSIHISNMQLIDPTNKKPTRIRMETKEKGKKIRIAVKSGKQI